MGPAASASHSLSSLSLAGCGRGHADDSRHVSSTSEIVAALLLEASSDGWKPLTTCCRGSRNHFQADRLHGACGVAVRDKP